MIMKTRYILLAIAALAASACSKDAAQNNTEPRLVMITASLEGIQGTRTAVQDGGTKVFWEPGDNINVFYGGTGNRFISDCTELSSTSSFSGSLSVVGGANEGASADSRIWGLYPYRADSVCDGESVTTTLPATQNGRAGSFAQNTNITVACSEDFGLSFYNVCGGLRFSLTQEGVKRVIFEGNNSETLAGDIKIAFEGGVPAVKETSQPATSITLKAPDGGTFQPGVWYYLSAIPVTLSNGFKMTFRKESESGVLTSNGAVTIKRGVFGSLANADAGVEYSSGSGDNPATIDITIDGDFFDWNDVTTGITSPSGSPVYKVFKATADDQYLYLYSKRDKNSAIWGVNQGYFYYDIDADNNSSTGVTKDDLPGLEMWMYLYLYSGTSSAPAFATEPNGGAYPSKDVYKSLIFAGGISADSVEIEIRLPLKDALVKKGDTVKIYSWGNKGAADFKKTPLVITL